MAPPASPSPGVAGGGRRTLAVASAPLLIVEDALEVDRCDTAFLREALAAILLDLVTPGLEGAAVGWRLRVDPATAAIPLIALATDPGRCDTESRPWADARLDTFHPQPLDALHNAWGGGSLGTGRRAD